MSEIVNPEHNGLSTISIEDEMQKSYLDYAMSVIVSRAIPDLRDGLKPVHRRILYAMLEAGCEQHKPYKKSARIVGEVMGKYHPHGDMAIYDALIRMAQFFSMRVMLIDGQGNFGSMDGDSPAAMRYTESRLSKAAHFLLEDIDKDTVDFRSNYDESESEPEVLPAEYPNILVNGANGIAVGMATNIPPHNLGEVVSACCAYIDNPDIAQEELLQIVPAPDFPTGGKIVSGIAAKLALARGRGSITIRATTHFETISYGKNNNLERQAIIITEMPYQVNKAKLIEKIAELVKEKRIEGISDLRDESDRQGVRVVIEIKRDATPEIVLNQLYNFTSLQTNFGVQMLVLNQGRPVVMGLRDIIVGFVAFRQEIVTRRTKFLLSKARDKAHLLIGLSIAVANIDEVIRLIRASKDPAEAKQQLLEREWQIGEVAPLVILVDDIGNAINDDSGTTKLTEIQAKAILDMRLQKLTGLEQSKISDELAELATEIKSYLHILSDREVLMNIIKEELMSVQEKLADDRKTEILNEDDDSVIELEDLIEQEDMVVTVTNSGYIKRVPLSTYKAQRRGGKGRSAMDTKDEDATSQLFIANTHTALLFFSNNGKVYRLKTYKLPVGGPQNRGKAIVNLLPIAEGEFIQTILPMAEDAAAGNIFFVTKNGNVRRNDVSDFENIQSNGKIAMGLEEGDELIGVACCSENNHVMVSTSYGKAVRFPAHAVRLFKSRSSEGVRGIKLADGDFVVSLTVLSDNIIEDSEQRDAYLKYARANLRGGGDAEEAISAADVGLSKSQIDDFHQGEQMILTVTENGYGKLSSAYEYRATNRGTGGIVGIVTSERNGAQVAAIAVNDMDSDVMLLTDNGTIIRSPISQIGIKGRNTQGVKLMNLASGEKITSISVIPASEDDEE